MKKIKSIVKKVKNLDVEGLIEGERNYSSKNPAIKELVLTRAEICGSCELCVDEPINELKISDSNKLIDGKMCDSCGCALPFLLRQTKKSCPLGKW